MKYNNSIYNMLEHIFQVPIFPAIFAKQPIIDISIKKPIITDITPML